SSAGLATTTDNSPLGILDQAGSGRVASPSKSLHRRLTRPWTRSKVVAGRRRSFTAPSCGTVELCNQASFDQAEPLPGKEAREAALLDQHTDLDVSLLSSLREIGARHERFRPIHHDALRVKAPEGRTGLENPLVVVEAWPRLSERPVHRNEPIEVAREMGLDV